MRNLAMPGYLPRIAASLRFTPDYGALGGRQDGAVNGAIEGFDASARHRDRRSTRALSGAIVAPHAGTRQAPPEPLDYAASAKAADAVADQLGADDQQQHGHDRRVVEAHPRLQLLEELLRALAHGEVDRDRDAGAKRGDDDEDRHRRGLGAR